MGKRIALTNGRRLVDDVIRMANRTPLASIACDWELREVAQLRRMAKPRISWNVLVMKAMAAVAEQMPMLKQGYVSFPWGHLYEHHQSVGMMTMSRQYRGEERLLFARFNEPNNHTLVDLQAQYDFYRKAPIEEIKQFRHQIMFAKCPSLLRRFAWWALFNVWPVKRAFHMGTFGMSISGHRGAYGSKHLGPNTATIGVDPMPKNGISRALFTFDHRVIDGAPASEIVLRTRNILNTAIRQELAKMAGVHPATLQPLKRNAA
ncbi:hypothetical protein [Mariniblastus fucicola]|uniref:Branched-chain alpha-keto acid dehydrogenase subunit E2 n=1 Tax=Mariniblastus fucicola TaxID=980251 RepID=A0A5B9PB40_9BACT|nr:hypothetical protein [Mariniblastus fucicola]QEG22405.1 branched-chain alpha-keto acid dehydrogenase subunit E2 [Mariniblastus fucicola]